MTSPEQAPTCRHHLVRPGKPDQVQRVTARVEPQLCLQGCSRICQGAKAIECLCRALQLQELPDAGSPSGGYPVEGAGERGG